MIFRREPHDSAVHGPPNSEETMRKNLRECRNPMLDPRTGDGNRPCGMPHGGGGQGAGGRPGIPRPRVRQRLAEDRVFKVSAEVMKKGYCGPPPAASHFARNETQNVRKIFNHARRRRSRPNTPRPLTNSATFGSGTTAVMVTKVSPVPPFNPAVASS